MQESRRETHPFDPLIKSEELLNAWCPGCGIGTVVNVFLQSVLRAKIDTKDLFVIAGMGCTGRIIDATKLDGERVVKELSFEYATRYKQKNPSKRVVVFANDADFITHGVDGFVESTRKGYDVLVIYINTMIYPIVHYDIAESPLKERSVYESREFPFNIPYLARACGAHHVARWTTIHSKRLSFSIADALCMQKFSIIEVMAPCLMYCSKQYRIKNSLERNENTGRARLDHDAAIMDLDIRLDGELIIGRFGGSQ